MPRSGTRTHPASLYAEWCSSVLRRAAKMATMRRRRRRVSEGHKQREWGRHDAATCDARRETLVRLQKCPVPIPLALLLFFLRFSNSWHPIMPFAAWSSRLCDDSCSSGWQTWQSTDQSCLSLHLFNYHHLGAHIPSNRVYVRTSPFSFPRFTPPFLRMEKRVIRRS